MKRMFFALLLLAAPAFAQEKDKVVEEIVARVNNEVITHSDLEHAQANIAQDVAQQCPNCTHEETNAAIAEKQKNLLRDLIDQSLLAQRGKDLGISVEADVIKQLDEIRVQNKLASMEDLEKAVTGEGLNWEDFKNQIRNTLLTRRVIGSEVSSHIDVGQSEIDKYYQAHLQEFVRPEAVLLREIFISTENKKESEIPDLKKKAEGLRDRVKNGDDFGELAKRFSDGSTAKDGGVLGIFKRGELSPEISDPVFKLKKNEITDVIQTKQGFLFLQVMEHSDEGQQSEAKVTEEIRERLIGERMDPAVRAYLKTLREESYVIVKPGFVDTGGTGSVPIQEITATPEAEKDKKQGHKKYILFGKRSGTGA